MTMRYRKRPEVVYVERGGDPSVKWLLWGAALGAGIALLYAPRSGEETRRSLQRRLWKLRAMTEEKLDELIQQFGRKPARARDFEEDDELEAPRSVRPPSARQELERRLAEARARRRAAEAAEAADDEEPLA
jgi:gas vesicle protein